MSSRRLAVLAFALHAPGLRVLGGYALNRRTAIANVVAVGLTAAAMALAWSARGSVASVVVAWLVGHFAWSTYLAAEVAAGRAGAPVEAAP